MLLEEEVREALISAIEGENQAFNDLFTNLCEALRLELVEKTPELIKFLNEENRIWVWANINETLASNLERQGFFNANARVDINKLAPYISLYAAWEE